MPERSRPEGLRRAFVDTPDRVQSALEDPGFLAAFGPVRTHESLKRVPPGYPADHPLADLLRAKDLVFGRPLADEETLSQSPGYLADGYAAAVPVFRFLASAQRLNRSGQLDQPASASPDRGRGGAPRQVGRDVRERQDVGVGLDAERSAMNRRRAGSAPRRPGGGRRARPGAIHRGGRSRPRCSS
jgi:hypothetical protein